MNEKIEEIRPTRIPTWGEVLRLAWHTPIVVVSVSLTILIVYPLGFHKGQMSVSRQEIAQRAGWAISVATYNECFDRFVKPLPRSARELRQSRSASCLEVSEVAMNGRYEAMGGFKDGLVRIIER